jgi:hypothetical protein
MKLCMVLLEVWRKPRACSARLIPVFGVEHNGDQMADHELEFTAIFFNTMLTKL